MNQFSHGPIKSLENSKVFLRGKSYCSSLSGSTAEYFASYLEKRRDASSVKELHARVIKQGLGQNIFLGSKLLNSLATFNLLAESSLVFNRIVNNNLSLWNTSVVGYFRAHQHDEVLGLYLNLRQRKLGIHSSAITFALKCCVRLGTSEFGRNLHTDALKFGLSYDRFVGSSLIAFTLSVTRSEAAKVFDEIADRDVVAYTSMITGYSQLGDRHASKAFRVAHDMQSSGFEPNRVTFVSLLKCASRCRALNKGRSIHGYAIRRQVGYLDEIFETCLIDMYIKCGDPDSGGVLFDMMNRKSTGSYNVLMAGYLQAGQPLEATDLFLQMVRECELDLIALANGLLCCADLGYLLMGKTIHSHIIREGIDLDLVGTTSLIEMYAKCKQLSTAMNIFNSTEAKDAALFNVMISGFLFNGHVFRAVKIFHEMVSTRVRPNTGTIIDVLSALSETGDIHTSKCIHGYVFRQGLEANTEIANQFVTIYAKSGFIGCARQVFDRTKIKDRVSWTSMVTALVNHGLAGEAMAFFVLMQRENLRPDAITLTCLLQALNQLGSLILVREVHARIYRVFLEKDTTLTNSLITTYSKHGNLRAATNLFNSMSEKHLSSYNTMVAAHGMHGDFLPALKLFDQITKANVSPDAVTFKSFLSACSHNGVVEEGLRAFSSMERDYGVIPSDEHYSCLVDLLCRAGRIEEAYNIMKQFPSRRSASALSSLLAACRIHGYHEIGESVARWLLEMEPENASAHCSVSNMYAGGERWDEVARVGALAKRKGLRRASGYSLVHF